jgi:hypothetical protein
MSQDKYTKLARGRECYVMLPVCNFDHETVVFAHIRKSGMSGMGIKAPSIMGCPACSDCHDAVDRRANTDLDRDYVKLAHLEGMVRWQYKLIQDGVIKL